MKTIKRILTNLILVFTLVILTSGVVNAAFNGYSVKLQAVRNSRNEISHFTLQLMKNGKAIKLSELKNDGIEDSITITLESNDFNAGQSMSFDAYVEEQTVPGYEGWVFPNYVGNATYEYNENTGNITIYPSSLGSQVIENISVTLSDGYEQKTFQISDLGGSSENPSDDDSTVIQNYEFRIKKKYVNGRLETHLEVLNGTFNNIRGIKIYSGEIERETINPSGGVTYKLRKEYEVGKTYRIREQATGNWIGTATVEGVDAVDNDRIYVKDIVAEQEIYYLEFNGILKELQAYNHGKKFTILVKRVKDWKEVMEFDSNKNESKIKLDNQSLLKPGERISVRMYCTETGFEKEEKFTIPELSELGKAKYIVRGISEVYNKNNELVTNTYIKKIMGFTTSAPSVQLCYDNGGRNVIDTGKFSTDNRIYFENVQNFEIYDDLIPEDITSDTKENINTFINQNIGLFNYYKAVKANGNTTVYLTINDYKGNLHRVDFMNPPSFQELTGYTMEDFAKFESFMSLALDTVATCVDDGKIEISKDEIYKDIYLSESGIYFIYQTNEVGVFLKKLDDEIRVINSVVDNDFPILYAGKLLEDKTSDQEKLEEEEEKALGIYIYYDAGSISYGYDSTYANCFPIVGNARYRIYNSEGIDITVAFKKIEEEEALVEIFEESDISLGRVKQSETPGYQAVQTAYIPYDEGSFFTPLGNMLAAFVRTLANGLNYLVQLSLQSVAGDTVSETVDIDKIIFNKYPDTSIAFFNSNVEAGGTQSKLIGMFKDGVNGWYNVFQGIAVAGYLVILLYIGVRILFNVGGSNQAKYKEMLMAWLSGLILLVFFPYVISFAINLNNQFVAMVDASKMEILKMEDTSSSIDMSDFSLPTIPSADDYTIIASGMEKNPYAQNDNSYMAVMANKAHTTGNLVDAVVYLIMVWQFVMIVILYYKRVFTVAFLIAVFPFVALIYVIDKIGDSKAQAFQTWTKEMMVNIFVQSIHAIVYVFVIGATYTEGQYNGDWLLSIVAISFLFQGEEILKKIIGVGGDTVTSLARTAQKTVATVGAIKLATKSVADNVVGAKSHLGRTVSTYRQWRTEKRIADNMDFLTSNKTTTSATSRSALPAHALTGDTEHDALVNDVNTLNNWESATPEQLAKALDNVLLNKNSMNQNIQGAIAGLSLSDDQLNALHRLQTSTVKTLVEGDKSTPEKYSELKAKIDHDMDIKLEAIFPESKDRREMMKRAMYFKLRDGDRDEKHLPRSTDRIDVKAEFKDAKNKRLSFFNPAEAARHGNDNPFSDDARPSRLSSRASSRKDSIMSTYFSTNGARASIGEARMAESIAILKDFGSLSSTDASSAHKYTAKQLMDAAEYVAEHQNDSKQNNNAVMNTLGVSGKDARAIVSEEIAKQFTDNAGGDKKQFRERFKVGAKAKIDKPTNGTNMEKRLAVQNTKDTWEKAIKYIKEDDAKAGDKRCYEESLNRVSIKDVMRKERDTYYDEDSYVDYLVSERELQNELEAMMIEDFAREQLDDLPEYSNAPKYEGLTKEEHEKYAKDLRNKFMEELGRTTATTSGVVLGASIGAGLSIGISDGDSAIKEAAAGVVAGTIAGDWVAENAFGREEKTSKVQILNPYTGNVETFELQTKGMASDFSTFGMAKHGTIKEGEILKIDDPRLSNIKYDIDRKFIENKKIAERKAQSEKKKQAYNEALRNKKS